MNYYEHHLGDYAEATAHLSFVEDAAYSRLIRKCYASEKPLPADVKTVQRLIGARTKEERDAVATVLDEFFVLQGDGWHNTRCDAEIARYQDKQTKAKRSAQERWRKQKAHSDGNANAMRTHERAPLAGTGQNGKKISDEAVSEKNKFSDDASLEPKNTEKSKDGLMRTHSDGNAHQTPDTRHQSPLIVRDDSDVGKGVAPPTPAPCVSQNADDQPPVAGNLPAAAVCMAIRAEGIASVNPAHPQLLALLADGVPIENFVSAARIAVGKGKGFAYALGIVQWQRADAVRIAPVGPPRESFRERDERLARERIARLTGAAPPAAPGASAFVIDAETVVRATRPTDATQRIAS